MSPQNEQTRFLSCDVVEIYVNRIMTAHQVEGVWGSSLCAEMGLWPLT